MSAAEKITDHARIRAWAKAQGATPAKSDVVEGGGEGALRFAFEGDGEALRAIGWDEFFEIFERNALALLVQEEVVSGETSRYSKFVAR